MTQALLIIDIQNDYFPGGKNELVGSSEAGAKAAQILGHFRARGLPIIHVQHIATKPNATFFLPGTAGAEINEAVTPEGDERVIVKHFPNAFRETELKSTLDKLSVSDLVVVGMMTHMCIDTTVRAASDLGFTVTLIGDACATKDLNIGDKQVSAAQVQVSYLAAIDGSFAKVVEVAGFLAA